MPAGTCAPSSEAWTQHHNCVHMNYAPGGFKEFENTTFKCDNKKETLQKRVFRISGKWEGVRLIATDHIFVDISACGIFPFNF